MGEGKLGEENIFLIFNLKYELEIHKGEFMGKNAECSIDYICIRKLYTRVKKKKVYLLKSGYSVLFQRSILKAL